ncbi:MAG: BrnT family toxin [Candidatus Methanofishera endochildressiae]|uniref:BrnT family toxin n=1 Tax=Candidatus Methanofishera endochildressiae TaxID=2738884 RepID=A0A7Z0MNM0_9GAMM|nr:BrnT family toxin [Candidatus Methanofishera endochildressiae]
MHNFEFDDKKSASNLSKHDIDFVSAQALWDDPDLVEVQATSDSEPRFLLIGCIGNKHWSAVITYREGNIRIISVRQSRKSEVELYES